MISIHISSVIMRQYMAITNTTQREALWTSGWMPHRRLPSGWMPYRRLPNGWMPYRRIPSGWMPYRRLPSGWMPYRRLPDVLCRHRYSSVTVNNRKKNILHQRKTSIDGTSTSILMGCKHFSLCLNLIFLIQIMILHTD